MANKNNTSKKRGKKRRQIGEEKSLSNTKRLKFDSKNATVANVANDNSDGYRIWEDLGVCSELVEALKLLKFKEPTRIQREVIPIALRDRQDVFGVAETGSGKTLAFGIPVVQRIIDMKSSSDDCEDLLDDDVDEPPDEDEDTWSDQDMEVQDADCGLAGELTEIQDGKVIARHSLQFDLSAAFDNNDCHYPKSSPLYCLVLTPTRELAVQVRDHLRALTKCTTIRIEAIFGGLSQQKQERLLSRCPEIVVATPGRIWDLMQSGDRHLSPSSMAKLPLFVVDEADRMAEKGHFQELQNILDQINKDEELSKRRQNFLFSATLTFVHQQPNWGAKKFKKMKKMRPLTESDRVDQLRMLMRLPRSPKVVDVTCSVAGLSESKISCSSVDKDLYLFWFLRNHDGRVLVFCNSKDSVRRLYNVLNLLLNTGLKFSRCCWALHADMHQKQRLKNLERFQSHSQSVLLCTDVAARGLDIPNIQHVVHFQIPRIAELYVHRSGRTARALATGSSVAFVAPDEADRFRKIRVSLDRDECPVAPVNLSDLKLLKPIVSLVRHLEALEHRASRRHVNKSWFQRAAVDMDVELTESDLPEFIEHNEEGVVQNDVVKLTPHMRKQLQMEKARLQEMLRQLDSNAMTVSLQSTLKKKLPFVSISKKYPTQLASITTSRGTSAVF